MKHRSTIYPLTAARTLALYAQRLRLPNGPAQNTTPGGAPDRDALYRVIEQIGCVQIDTLQMVQRSHYIAL